MSALTLSTPGIVPFVQLVQEAVQLARSISLEQEPQSQFESATTSVLSREMLVLQDPWLDWIDTL